LYTIQARPPKAFRAAHSTFPALYSAQDGAEYSVAFNSVGVLQAAPLKIAFSNPPSAAVAAQSTLPAPSPVQLGIELTAPVRLFQAPQVVPLNSLTVMADSALRAAQTTCPVEMAAQDGLPTPSVPAPVDFNLLQLAQAVGANNTQTVRSIRRARIVYIDSLL